MEMSIDFGLTRTCSIVKMILMKKLGDDMQNKVIEVNLEYGRPTVEQAIQNLKNMLTTYRSQGYKAAILIHGYGSTGVGGSIKPAVIRCLGENSMRGIVRAFASGEAWYTKKREFLGMCKGLENYERRISSNEGVTVVILK